MAARNEGLSPLATQDGSGDALVGIPACCARTMMRLGDYILCISMTLNTCAMVAYLYQRHYAQAFYWLAALQLNLSLLWMK